MFYDLALKFDPASRRCDLVIGDDGDLVIDETSVTPMMMSIGLDRRADEDDPLPEGRTEFLTPPSFSIMRGCAGDALDLAGRRTGSKLWLLDRAKATEQTRLFCEFWLKEALEWVKTDIGSPPEITVTWADEKTLKYRVQIDAVSVSKNVLVGA